MSSIQFDKQQKEILISKLQNYMQTEFEFELGQFDGEFLLDFISEHIGAFYYNQGLADAQQLLESKLDTLTEGFYELEKLTD
jgi:uncharacterized protein (DUF2164 family)